MARRFDGYPGSEFSPVPVRKFSYIRDYYIGSLYVIKPLLELIGLRAIVDEAVPDYSDRGQIVSTGEVTEILVANRLNSPTPLVDVEAWADLCGIQHMFGVDPKRLNDDRLARALEALDEHQDEIQTKLAFRLMKEFGLGADEVIWDTTAFYFEGDYDEAELIKFGYSPDHRSDLKQIKLAMAVDKESGVPMRQQLIEGRLADQKIAVESLLEMKAKLGKSHILVMGDNAVGTIPNLLRLNSEGVKFIAPCPSDVPFREAMDSVSQEEFDRNVWSDGKGESRFKYAERRVLITPEMTTSPDAKGTSPFTARVLIVWSESKARLDRERRETYMRRVEERLRDIGEMKLNRRRYKDKDYAQSQVDKIFEGPTCYLKAVYSHPRVVEVHDGPDGQAALKLEYGVDQEELRKLERRDGVYPVVTNLADGEEYPLKQIFERTRRKYQVERPMRYMKSRVRVRPVFLHKEERVRGLALVCFIALIAYCLLEHLAKKHDRKLTSHQVLKKYVSITYTAGQTLNGERFATVVNVTGEHMNLIRRLGLARGSYSKLADDST
ncbi:MAG TPA: IS1634 family transposase [Firmicutes bacterium]|nr:IS1634 family transposase [Bacillota bacterium]